MLTIFEEPKMVEFDRILSDHLEGADLFVQKLPDSRMYLVYGEVPYGETYDEKDCFSKIQKQDSFIKYDGLRVINIYPAQQTFFKKEGRFVWTKQSFYQDKYQRIEREYDLYRIHYSALPSQMRIFYVMEMGGECVTYLGSTVDATFSTKEIKLSADRTILECTYADYLRDRVKVLEGNEASVASPTPPIPPASPENATGRRSPREERQEMIRRKREEARRNRRNERMSELFLEEEEEAIETLKRYYPNLDAKKILDRREEAKKKGLSLRRYEIAEFLKRVKYADFYKAISSRVKGQNELNKVVAGVYNYLVQISRDKQPNCNMMITAPSGCGKTETYRALKDYFKIEIPLLPVAIVDLANITESGFKGNDPDTVVRALFNTYEPDGIGLIFMDEFDKKLLPSYTSGGEDVNGHIQAQLLTMIEGTNMSSGPFDDGIYTGNAMFIGIGSFDICRAKKEKIADKNVIGFLSAEEKKAIDHFDAITREEMIEIGASNELIGRFTMIVNYGRLTDEVVDEIIDGYIKRIESDIDYRIMITEERRRELHEKANGKFGCRLLYNEIYDQIMLPYSTLLAKNARHGYYAIVIDVDGKVEVLKGWHVANENATKETFVKEDEWTKMSREDTPFAKEA